MKVKGIFILYLLLVALMGGLAGCEDRMDEEITPEGKDGLVTVSMMLDFASETDGYGAASGSPRARAESGITAFSASLCPQVLTRDGTRSVELQPDALYNLEIRQYDVNSGAYLAGQQFATAAIGTALEVSLVANTDCQLVIVARGKDNTVKKALGTSTLQKVQENITADSTVINSIDPTNQESMNKMPYVLHLEHVKVVKNAENKYIIQSPDGAHDVRMRLKRIAARVNLVWDYAVSGYDMKQVLIQSVPLMYSVVNSPDKEGAYPSLIQQFTTIEVATVGNKGSFSRWVPANARGTSAAASSDAFRTKANAPQGSTFVNFVAVDKSDSKKKLDYRVYLGNGEPSDFNVLNNTNYNYTVNFHHEDIPADDGRVTYIDPIPASQGNNNLLPTANCFMVEPGGAFCFDPLAFQQNGISIENDKLKEWCQSGGIKYVRLLWQTKENGDVGDPVMGIVNSDTDHANIVEIKRTDNSTITAVPATKKGDCLIYCRTAANTSGGSGVIAAYDGATDDLTNRPYGNILWSWHVWVTDYHPDATGTETVLTPVNKRKLRLMPVSSSDGTVASIMMDRNLGAYEAAFGENPKDILEMSRTNGFHYQKGRKDPFPSSYTTQKLPNIYNFTLSADAPPKNIMNRYDASGLHAIVPVSIGASATSLRNAYQHPVSMAGNAYYSQPSNWCSDRSPYPTWNVTKTIHDPCPAGWRVPQSSELKVLANRNTTIIPTSAQDDGGVLLYYDTSGDKFYVRFSGYPPAINQLNTVGRCGYMAGVETMVILVLDGSNGTASPTVGTKQDYDAHTTRCVQEKIK